MRASFISTLRDLARSDQRIFLLTGDVGYMVLETFAEEFPDRFINVGVAEQNMIGIATGLAEAGYIPFTYSIAPFACLRPYEFIRNGPIMHKLPVRIVGIGGGMTYSHSNLTHHGLEDIAVMRAQPDLHVIVPADHQQASCALKATYDLPGPIYFRIEKSDYGVIPGLNGKFSLGKSDVVHEGADLLVITAGSIAGEAKQMACNLLAQDITCRVLVVSTLNPSPATDLLEHLKHFRNVMTVESHYQNGGLGSLVAEVVADQGLPCRVIRNAVKTMPDSLTGSKQFMEKHYGLDSNALTKKAMEIMTSAYTPGAGR